MDETVESSIFHPFLDAFRTEQKYFDVDVRIGDRTFKSHRLLLAMLSRYFDDLFRGKAGTGDVEIVVLDDVDSSAFQKILDIMYTGEVGIIDDFYSVLKACDVLKVRSTFFDKQCMIVSKKRKPMQNVFTLREYAYKTDRILLFESLRRNICNCAEYYFFWDDSFLELSFHSLIVIFKPGYFKDFISKNADRLADAFIRWIHHSRDERQVYLEELMNIVKKDFSPGYMMEMFGSLCRCLSYTDKKAPVLERIIRTLPRYKTKYEDEKLLNIYIQPENKGFIQELSRANSTCWSPLMKLPLWYTMKRSGMDDKVYCLTYDSVESLQTFFYRSLSEDSEDQHQLKLPPYTLSHFQMHPSPIEKIIYVYDEDMYLTETGMWMFDCPKNHWYALKPKCPSVREYPKSACMAVDDDAVYLIGELLQAYKHRTRTWHSLVRPEVYDRHLKYSCCIHQGKIYFGSKDGQYFHRYDFCAGKWEALPTNLNMKNYELISYANQLYAIGLTKKDNMPCEKFYDVSGEKWSVSQFSFYETVKECSEECNFDIKDCVVF